MRHFEAMLHIYAHVQLQDWYKNIKQTKTKNNSYSQKQIQKIVQQDTVPNELNNKGKNFICVKMTDGWPMEMGQLDHYKYILIKMNVKKNEM